MISVNTLITDLFSHNEIDMDAQNITSKCFPPKLVFYNFQNCPEEIKKNKETKLLC